LYFVISISYIGIVYTKTWRRQPVNKAIKHLKTPGAEFVCPDNFVNFSQLWTLGD
jgi:hypothetical protein